METILQNTKMTTIEKIENGLYRIDTGDFPNDDGEDYSLRNQHSTYTVITLKHFGAEFLQTIWKNELNPRGSYDTHKVAKMIDEQKGLIFLNRENEMIGFLLYSFEGGELVIDITYSFDTNEFDVFRKMKHHLDNTNALNKHVLKRTVMSEVLDHIFFVMEIDDKSEKEICKVCYKYKTSESLKVLRQ
jgi:hypothetical protein